eukprot:TRINITY_DN32477_c1_g1_i2.p1 TRINITY_DN32477_c1_g1~~TRINITY_DN32477_c1_g1_i2.p1  ORF type:complete len:445 (+),score=148.76 TRINITY_DN32477_c1_g1_i2:86-1336(+)
MWHPAALDPAAAAAVAAAAPIADPIAMAAAAAAAAASAQWPPAEAEQLAVWEGCDKETMNLEWGLHRNISDDDYYKSLAAKALIEEAHEEGGCCNAWTEGGRAVGHHFAPIVLGRTVTTSHQGWGTTSNSIRGCTAKHQGQAPSRLWCVLLRLYQLRPSEEQVRGMIAREERPLVRALGVLYVRLTQHPSKFLDFLTECLADEHAKVPLSRTLPGRQGEAVTMAQFTRTVLLEQKCLETVLPRVPEKHLREIRVHLGLDASGRGDADRDGERDPPTERKGPQRRKAETPREREEARARAKAAGAPRRRPAGRLWELDGPPQPQPRKRSRSRSRSSGSDAPRPGRRRRPSPPRRAGDGPKRRDARSPPAGAAAAATEGSAAQGGASRPAPRSAPPLQQQQQQERIGGALAKLAKLAR